MIMKDANQKQNEDQKNQIEYNKNKNNKDWLEIFNDLRMNTRMQLNRYPVVTAKQKVRLNINSIIFSRKILKLDRFFWPNGLLALSLEWAFKSSKDIQDFNGLLQYYDLWIENGTLIYNLDNAINGYSLIYVHQITKDNKYKSAIIKIKEYLLLQVRDKKDSLPYRVGSPDDIYIDSIGMICPFLCRYGNVYKDPIATSLAIKQIINFIYNGFDESTLLPYHGYNLKEKYKMGIIGWGRAVGWLLIGMVDSIEYIDPTNSNYAFLCRSFRKIVNTTIKYQKKNGYYSWQLTALEGHIDTSSTSMISYAIKRGVMTGLLNKSYLYHSNLGLLALRDSIINGVVINSSAECMGFSMYPQRYDVFPWSQGPTTALMALSLNRVE